MTDAVVTRFAPSPTGFLHIGGARTALFNWLYARATGGKMLLRIEDTDRARSTEPAVQAIIDGLDWMGLTADEPPVSQYERAARHREVVEEMLAKGEAYRCYASQAELEEMRETARAEKRPPRYDGRWRDRDPSEAPEGVKPVIRLRAPLEGETIVRDKVQGDVRFPNKDLDDLVLLRSDGSPTYMLAVVVDDHDMGVTHVIRGDDHLTNAGRQTLIISTEEMIEWFDLGEINKGAARFDFAKLEALNGHWIRRSDDAELVDMLMAERDVLPNGGILKTRSDDEIRSKLTAAMPGLKERAKTLVELTESTAYLFADRPLSFEDKAAAILNDGGREIVGALAKRFEAAPDWSAAELEAIVRAYAEENGLKLGKAAQPLRAALTGRTTSPGVFDVLAVLGRDESLARLGDQSV